MYLPLPRGVPRAFPPLTDCSDLAYLVARCLPDPEPPGLDSSRPLLPLLPVLKTSYYAFFLLQLQSCQKFRTYEGHILQSAKKQSFSLINFQFQKMFSVVWGGGPRSFPPLGILRNSYSSSSTTISHSHNNIRKPRILLSSYRKQQKPINLHLGQLHFQKKRKVVIAFNFFIFRALLTYR